ncbi:FAD-dependent oxidoreductase [Cohnella pontilimi]|uniref:FAD-dependent oxidoreductase n=1 Tax=Cohnella pontilimi TaxID=2564100 RepID=A0A4U0F577_9BACL|nr:FAD-dependent oxidoreductase [Cohnella pontilimi]TJY39540.1 FAD-dependent oxidoreductase [Cohnella pontilimi]
MPALSLRKKQVLLLALFFIIVISGLVVWQLLPSTQNHSAHQKLQPVHVTGITRPSYDVIVTGTDPEGIMAAVSAARNGLSVLLVDGKNRDIFGGLLTLGWLNSLDNNYSPKQQPLTGKHNFLNKGLFQEWYDQIEGTSFDVNTAANVFHKMVANEKNIDVLLKVRKMEPLMEGSRVAGLRVEKEDRTVQDVPSKVLIDATQDADIAAAAHVPYTFGREDIGEPDARMAVTVVFKMSGVTQQIWDSFGQHKDSGVDKMSAWGFPEAKDYVSSDPARVKLRGLNIGRQNDGTILINAMHIYEVNPLTPESVQAGLAIGRKEAPLMAAFLKNKFKEFKDLEYAGTAPELYIRESRHIMGEYRLKMTDLMENRNFDDAIAYGSYEVDIQSTSPDYPGAILMKPQAYGVPFRCLVPQQIDGLLVVGRSASYDSLPHGSARVVPLGMATGQAAGAAAKLAIDKAVSLRELSRSKEDITQLRALLKQQGMDLQMPDIHKPEYAKHPDYPGLLAAVSMFITSGNYHNKSFDLDGSSNAKRFANQLSQVKKAHREYFKGNPQAAAAVMAKPEKKPLSLGQAAYTIALAAGIETTPDHALKELKKRKWLRDETVSEIKDPNALTNGECFMLIRDVVELYAGVKYK